jgi:hypothetical protein
MAFEQEKVKVGYSTIPPPGTVVGHGIYHHACAGLVKGPRLITTTLIFIPYFGDINKV